MKIELGDGIIEPGDICLDPNSVVYYIVHNPNDGTVRAIEIENDRYYDDAYTSVEELVEEYELTLLSKRDKIKIVGA